MMKTSCLIRVLFPVAMISVAAAMPSQAQTIANALTNGDFETQNPQIATNAQVKTGFSTLTGFQDISPPGSSEDSGIQGTNKSTTQKAESGSYFIFAKGGDPGAFQITSTQLQANQTLTLTWYAANSYQAPIQEVGILTAASTSSTFSAALQPAVANGATSSTYALPTYVNGSYPYNMYTLTYTVQPADVGQYVGIFLEDTATTAANSFVNFDNFDLAITTVPEPETWVAGLLTVGMATGLIVTSRRKQTLSKSLPV